MNTQSDRNLLVGVIALQMDFVDQAHLMNAFNAWVLDKTKPLEQILVEQNAIAPDSANLLKAMLEKHLELHGADPKLSLAATVSHHPLPAGLRGIKDEQFEQSMALLSSRQSNGPDTIESAGTSVPSELFGLRFRKLRAHAKGGLGVVSVARDEQLNREVALKEILPEYSGRKISRDRFLLEAEVTGRLEHPGVVPVYGLGHDSKGRPFYAMRFVVGQSLREAIVQFHTADPMASGSRHLELRKLLGRFLDVCQALEYAHSRGVLHRDLKPGNIMLGKHGETLVVDWGLAKATGGPDPSTEVEDLLQPAFTADEPTEMGSAIGTPAYMSPEQASGQIDKLGPLSDVYGLGATLFCLLTGHPPVEGKNQVEVLQKVRKGEIPPARSIRPDTPKPLDAICRKAMALRPEDRYASCQLLADDVDRWLANEPVTAWTESLLVKARRWLSQHQTFATAAAILLFATVMASTIGTVVVGRMNTLLTESNTQMKVAEADARRKEAIATAINDFLLGDLLGSLSPWSDRLPDRNRNITLRELLDRASARIVGRFTDEPLVEASIQSTIAITYLELGEHLAAEPHARRCLKLFSEHRPEDDQQVLRSHNTVAHWHHASGDLKRAVEIYRRTIPMAVATLGKDHADTLHYKHQHAYMLSLMRRLDESETLINEVIEARRRTLGPNNEQTLSAKNVLASIRVLQSRWFEAETIYADVTQSLKDSLGENHPETLAAQCSLGRLYIDTDRFREAANLLSSAYERSLKHFGEYSSITIGALKNLAYLQRKLEKFDLAEELYLKGIEASTRDGDDGDITTISMRTGLAGVLLKTERFEEAKKILEKNCEVSRRRLGENHTATMTSMNVLGFVYQKMRQYDTAQQIMEETLARRRKTHGVEHASTLLTMNNLSLLYQERGKYDEAEKLISEAIELRKQVIGPDHHHTLMSMNNLALIWARRGEFEKARVMFAEVWQKQRRVLGNAHSDTLITHRNLASMFRELEQFADAESHYRAILQHVRATGRARTQWGKEAVRQFCLVLLGQQKHRETIDLLEQWETDPQERAARLIGFGMIEMRKGHAAGACSLLERSVKIRQEEVPDQWLFFNAQTVYGGALTALAKQEDAAAAELAMEKAEPLLLSGYQGLKQRQNEIPETARIRIGEAAQRLVEFYDQRGRDGDSVLVARWKEELSQWQSSPTPR